MYTYKKDDFKVPIKTWIDKESYFADDNLVNQITNIAKLPFLHSHVALMPDGHFGYGAPIGSVFATKGVVIPSAVGVDIGCGVCFVSSDVRAEDIRPHLSDIVLDVKKHIPVGRGSHTSPVSVMPDMNDQKGHINKLYMNSRELEKRAACQLGTLGGGNHFIELQVDEDGFVGIMIHSGSRSLGKQIADIYNRTAKDLNQKWHTPVPPSHGLAFLPLDTHEGLSYFDAMRYCTAYALANRQIMMSYVKAAIYDTWGAANFSDMINVPHNYASIENHFGKNVIIHRKGATSAKNGEIGIIPGSMGHSSYIVRGLGNPESFMSCSHGAGRKMSRSKAKEELNLESEMKRLSDMGIHHDMKSEAKLDEAPGAYKSIGTVMANQTDLVDKVKKLLPLAVIKG